MCFYEPDAKENDDGGMIFTEKGGQGWKLEASTEQVAEYKKEKRKNKIIWGGGATKVKVVR